MWQHYKIGGFFSNLLGLSVELQVGLTIDLRILLFFLQNAAFELGDTAADI